MFIKLTLNFIFFLLASRAVFGQDAFTIKGEISGIADGTLIFLTYGQGVKDIRDSCVVHNGRFIFKNKVKTPSFGYLLKGFYPGSKYKSTSDYRMVYLEKGVIKLSGDENLKYAKLSGTPNNNALQIYADLVKPTEKKKDKAQEVFYKVNSDGIKEEDKELLHVYNEDMAILKAEEMNIKRSYAFEYPNTALTLHMLRDITKSTSEVVFLKSIYDKMDTRTRSAAEAINFKTDLDALERLAIGKEAPDFSQNDSLGQVIHFSKFREGKYVLIDFWASWCAPCRAENPNLLSAYNKYKDDNFDILGIALERNIEARDNWLKAIKNDKLLWAQVTDFSFWNNSVAKLYNIQSIPSNFLVDPDGRIVGKNLRGKDLHIKLIEIFGH